MAPPCTSFSPACHPALRSYALPRGFNPLHPKVHLGNCWAFVALTLLYVALRLGVFGIGEQPRRSKMRWLREWRRLVDLGATEVTLASCSYGSHHQKEFGVIGANMDLSPLASKCSRDHEHIKIQGSYTRPSAVYCPKLAEAIAKLFYGHLRARGVQLAKQELKVEGNRYCQMIFARPWSGGALRHGIGRRSPISIFWESNFEDASVFGEERWRLQVALSL